MIFTLIIGYWKRNYGRILLSMIGMSLSAGLLTVLGVLFWSTENKFTRELSRIQAVVGAKGSPLQLVLSSVFHLDYPTGNIPLAEAKKIIQHPLVEKAIPISLGDTYQNYRIVGTSTDILPYYGASLQQGALWQKPLEVVAGSQVADRLSLKIGTTFHGSHGLTDNSLHYHEEHTYKVVGILAPTGLTIDNLLLTDTVSVWLVHHHQDEEEKHDHEHSETCNHDHEDDHFFIADEEKEITALLLEFKTPAALIQMPKYINKKTNLMVASPAFEVARLMVLVGNSTKIASLLIGFSFVIACMSVVITLLSLLQERQTDLALLRLLGGSRNYIATLLIAESCSLLLLSVFLGLLGGYAVLAVATIFWQDAQTVIQLRFYTAFLWLFPISILIGILIAGVLVAKTFRWSIIKLLS